MITPPFPSWFPPDCPPETASDASRPVYRIVASTVLSDSDFLSHHELGTALSAPPCLRCGLSVYNSFENALHRLRLSPRLGKAIAEGLLESAAGKTEITSPRSGHVAWWASLELPRSSWFGDPTLCT